MSDRFAILIGALLCGLCALDVLQNDAQVIIFLGQRLLEVLAWMAFWR